MNSNTRQLLRALAALSVSATAAVSSLHAQAWNVGNSSGNWSIAANWVGSTVPTTGNTATLGDVTSGNRTITYDTGASGTLGTLSFTQTTAGAVNQLLIARSLVVTNALTLGATAGAVNITLGSNSTVANTLAVGGAGLTLNSGSSLNFTSTTNAAGSGMINSGFGNSTQALTISGGSLTLDPSTGGNTTTSATNNLTGTLTMTSGAITINNASGTGDRRLAISGNTSITGGTITSTLNASNGAIFMSGVTNTFSPATFSTNIGITLDATVAQSLSSNITLGGLTVRGTGIKTVASSGTVGTILFLDNNNGTANSATTLKLGANLTLTSGAAQPSAATFSQTAEASGNRTDFGIDTGGFILDLSTGSSSGIWTPNVGATNNLPVWTLSGGGTIRANGFNLSTTNVTTVVSSGTTLNAVGGSSTASNLGGVGTINAGSSFTYSGSANATNPATLTSNRTIGNLNVSSGNLRLNSSLTAGGLTTVGTGATLDLSNSTFNTTGLTVNNGTISSVGNLTISGAGANVLKTGSNTFGLTNTASSYTGTTTLQDGRLNFTGSVPSGANSVLGNATSAIIVGTAASTGAQRIQLFGLAAGTVDRDINATGGTAVASDPSSANRYRIGADITAGGTLTLNGALSYGSSTNATLTVGRTLELTSVQSNTNLVVNGLISSATGAASSVLINGGASGVGSVKLANSGNSFTNGITVTQGTLLVGGNAPVGGSSVLGNNTTAINLADGGTPAANWTIAANNIASGDLGNPAILTDGAFTVARVVNLSNAATFSGGPAPATTGNGAPNSYIIGGNAAASSTFSGNVTVATLSTADKLLRLSQVAGGTTTLSGVINANADVTRVLNVEKVGAGTVALSGTNLYDGTTTVSTGTLFINGNNAGATGAVSVAAGATLGGGGTVGGATTFNGASFLTVGSTGTNVGTLSFNNGLSLSSTASTSLDVTGTTRGTGYDGINVTGSTTYGGGLSVSFSGSLAVAGQDYDLFNLGTAPSGSFSSISITGLHTLSLTNNSGVWTGDDLTNNLTFTFTDSTGNLFISAIPEPSSVAALAGLAAVGMVALRRRRRAV
jgi:PEP-CTERM motif